MNTTRLINTASCWQVEGKFSVYLTRGQVLIVENGFVKQTPELFDEDKIKIVDRTGGQEATTLFCGEEIIKIEDEHGQPIWQKEPPDFSTSKLFHNLIIAT